MHASGARRRASGLLRHAPNTPAGMAAAWHVKEQQACSANRGGQVVLSWNAPLFEGRPGAYYQQTLPQEYDKVSKLPGSQHVAGQDCSSELHHWRLGEEQGHPHPPL